MNYLDQIIPYLSGELSEKEQLRLEKELKSNPELRAEFEEAEKAWELIRTEVRYRDEEDLRSSLETVMEADVEYQLKRPRLKTAYLLIPAVAATLLALLLIFLPDPGDEELFAAYFDPGKDQVVNASMQESRGENHPGKLHYIQGGYEKAYLSFLEQVLAGHAPVSDYLGLLLSALQLDREKDVLDLVLQDAWESEGVEGEALSWYTSLALLRDGRHEDALIYLERLSGHQGSYQQKAEKLQNTLLK